MQYHDYSSKMVLKPKWCDLEIEQKANNYAKAEPTNYRGIIAILRP
jgi:hypothetical protein